MRRALMGVTLVLGILAAGVSAACEHGKAKGTKAHHSGDNPVITVLERRGEIVTVKAGPNGPLYSARTKSGELIARDLTAAELQASHPDLYQFVKTSTAGGDAFMDARVELPSKE